MKKKFCRILSLFLLFMSLNGCTQQKYKIAYTVYPVGFLAESLSSDIVTVESIQTDTIVQRAVVKENYEEILEDSAVFLHIGQLEPYMTMYSSKFNSLSSARIDLSSMNAVYDFQRYTQVLTDGEITYVESPYYRGNEFDFVDIDDKDLYLWTDPIAMLSMAKDIRDWLLNAYPDEAPVINERYVTLENELINLDAQYQAIATSNEKNNKVIRFVTMSPSFGNWQKTYGFQVYPIILSKYGALPNEQQLAAIEKRIKDDGIKYIVYEPNMTQDMIELFNRVVDDLSLTRVELSNLSSLTESEEAAGKDYLSVMYENLAVLETMVEDRPTVAVTEQAEEPEPEMPAPTSLEELIETKD